MRTAIALVVLALTSAPLAGARPVIDLTDTDVQFIDATDELVVGTGPWAPDGFGWIGYSSWPAQERVEVAYGVCAMYDIGATDADGVVIQGLKDTREHAGYLAALFEQQAVRFYCPRHSDKIGSI